MIEILKSALALALIMVFTSAACFATYQHFQFGVINWDLQLMSSKAITDTGARAAITSLLLFGLLKLANRMSGFSSEHQ